jgi:hypothetical protein
VHGRRSRSPRARCSGRRAAFAALAVVLVVGVLELVAFAALWIVRGRAAFPATLQAERDAIAGAVSAAPQGATKTENEVNRWMLGLNDREMVHPYIGFVEDPDDPRRRNRPWFEPEAMAFGFPRNRHRLFHQPSDNLLLVAVVGGSLSRQVSFGAQELLEQRLATIERFRGRRVKVLSLGLGGHKQPQQVMVINYFLSLGMHIDVLLNIDGFNEVSLPITDNLELGTNPFYPRLWAFRVGAIDPLERRLRGKIELLRELRRDTAAMFSRRPWRLSLTCNLLWQLADRSLANRIVSAEHELLARGPHDSSAQAKGPPYEAPSKQAVARDLAQVWARSSLQLHALATASGIEYYHFLQPNQYDVAGKRLTSSELRLAYDPESPFRDPVVDGYPALRRAADDLLAAGVAFTDLGDIFNSVTGDIYIDPCCHVNAQGAALLVDRIVGALSRAQVRTAHPDRDG